jgi:peptidoglycan/LPS O-acetylase OafA/YrhL
VTVVGIGRTTVPIPEHELALASRPFASRKAHVHTAHRFATLDAMRGLAALTVVALHTGALGISGLSQAGYLAVDFFFVLSGFVLAHAYGDALESRRISAPRFLAARYLRLAPLAALGTLVSIALSPHVSWTDAVFGLLLIPSFTPGRAVYPLNEPLYSLFFELVANAVYGVVAPWITPRRLGALVIGVGSVFAATVVREHGAFPPSIARTCYSFFVGVGIYRLWRAGYRAPRIPATVLAMALLAAMITPSTGWHTTRDLVWILAVFPALVWCGASSVPSSDWLARRLGEWSYPLYTLHYRIVIVSAPWIAAQATAPLRLAAFGCLLVGLLGLAELAARVDRHVQRWKHRAL